MPANDRTDELIAAMLARRGRQPMSDDLLDRTVAAIAGERQARTGRASRRARWPGAARGTALVAALGVAAIALAAMLGAAQRPETGPAGSTAPMGIAGASASPAPTLAPAMSSVASPPSGTSAVADLGPDTLAVVTRNGNNLRVRSAPFIGPESELLKPLLPSGTRLLVLGGPVVADNHDWYEVMVEPGAGTPDAMYGWVARTGDGQRWIRSDTARCRGTPGPTDVADMSPFDFLACYHDTEVTLTARINEGQSGVDVECPWLNGAPCEVAEGWLLASTYVTYSGTDGRQRTVGLAVPPAIQPVFDRVPVGAEMTLIVGMDAPEALACRITDPATGQDLVPPNRVVTVCRLSLVVGAVVIGP